MHAYARVTLVVGICIGVIMLAVTYLIHAESVDSISRDGPDMLYVIYYKTSNISEQAGKF